MDTLSKQEVQQRLAQVTARLEQLDAECTALLKRQEFLIMAMAEFFGESDKPRQEYSYDAVGGASENGQVPLSDLTIAEAADIMVPDGGWTTIKELTEYLNANGKACSRKAVQLMLQRAEDKRWEQRNTGPVGEWRKIKQRANSSRNGTSVFANP